MHTGVYSQSGSLNELFSATGVVADMRPDTTVNAFWECELACEVEV